MMAAFAIGFWGYLNVSNINLTVVYLAGQPNNRSRLYVYLLLAMLAEAAYCLLVWLGLGNLWQNPDLDSYLHWLSAGILAVLGLWALSEALWPPAHDKAFVYRGHAALLLHPHQLPFWTFWSAYLTNNGWVESNNWVEILAAALAAGLGTLCVLTLYAWLGAALIQRLELNQRAFNLFIGLSCLGLCIWELLK